MNKKLLGIVLTILIVATMMPSISFAESVEDCSGDSCAHAAAIGSIHYDTLKEAINAASNGDVIVILNNFSVTATLAVEKEITIDLNGKTITRNQTGYATAGIFRPGNGGKLTITDTSEEKTGMLHAIADSEGWAAPVWVKPGGEVIIEGGTIKGENGGKSTYALYIEGTKDSPAKATMKGGNLKATSPHENSYTLSIHGDNASTNAAAFFTMTGGKIESDYVAINGNGLNAGTTIVIEDGQIVGSAQGIYHPQVGDLTIKGGSITGVGAGIGIKAGNLTITGGSIKATGEKATPESHNSGMNPSGAAIQIESHDGYGVIDGTKYKMNISISGGDIISENGYSVYEYLANNAGTESKCAIESLEISEGDFEGEVTLSAGINDESKVAAISGGTFDSKPNDNLLANNITSKDNEDGTFTAVDSRVAQIGDVKYNTLQEAIDAAQNGQTIVLVGDKDIDVEETVNIPAGKEITIDLNGREIYVYDEETGENLYGITNRGKLTLTDSSTEKDGEAWRVDNYGELIIDGGEIYVLNNDNNARVVINDGTLSYLYGTGFFTVNGGIFPFLDPSAFVDKNAIVAEVDVYVELNQYIKPWVHYYAVNDSIKVSESDMRYVDRAEEGNANFNIKKAPKGIAELTVDNLHNDILINNETDSTIILNGHVIGPKVKGKKLAELPLDKAPEIIEGENAQWTKGSKAGLKIVSDGIFARFIEVKVDGDVLDRKNYTVVEGSTVVNLDASYLENLAIGNHTIQIVSTNGTAETSFTIKADTGATGDGDATKENTDKTTKTGDDSNTAPWIALMAIAAAAGTGTVLYRRKNTVK